MMLPRSGPEPHFIVELQQYTRNTAMKTQMRYGAKLFGNNLDAPEYSIILEKERYSAHLRVEFRFHAAAPGRGVGESRGRVQSVAIVLTRDAAEVLAHVLHAASAELVTERIVVAVNEARMSARPA